MTGKHAHPNHEGFFVTCSSLEHGNRFRRQCTSDGSPQQHDLSPALQWHNAPETTKTFALTIVDIDAPDPDGPTIPFTHWVLLNIPADMTSLPEGFSGESPSQHRKHAGSENGGDELQEGINDFKLPHYRGPSPPKGEHRYVITVYALDSAIHAGSKVHREKLEEAMEGHVVAKAELTAVYSRDRA